MRRRRKESSTNNFASNSIWLDSKQAIFRLEKVRLILAFLYQEDTIGRRNETERKVHEEKEKDSPCSFVIYNLSFSDEDRKERITEEKD
jgi:hypothetical protein